MASPLSPWPAVERSKVEPVAPATVVPFTFQTQASVVVSPSASLPEAVAVSVSFVFGDGLESETVAVGALFATVTPVAVNGAEAAAPSDAVTEYEIESPLSPLPAAERSSVGAVAQEMSLPFFVHW